MVPSPAQTAVFKRPVSRTGHAPVPIQSFRRRRPAVDESTAEEQEPANEAPALTQLSSQISSEVSTESAESCSTGAIENSNVNTQRIPENENATETQDDVQPATLPGLKDIASHKASDSNMRTSKAPTPLKFLAGKVKSTSSVKNTLNKAAEIQPSATLSKATISAKVLANTTPETEQKPISVLLTSQTLPRSHRGRQIRAVSPENSMELRIDEENVTMSDLCNDWHIGKISSKYEEIKKIEDDKKKIAQKKLGKKKLREKGLPVSDDEDSEIKLDDDNEYRPFSLDGDEPKSSKRVKPEQRDSMNSDGTTSEKGHPQLQISGGRIDIVPSSLQRNWHEDNQTEGTEVREKVESSSLHHVVTSASWSRREKSERWNQTETELFYNGLSMWGTDFGMIAQMFIGRSRRQIKNKFNSEERKNPAHVRAALNRTIPVDLEKMGQLGASISKQNDLSENIIGNEQTQETEELEYNDQQTKEVDGSHEQPMTELPATESVLVGQSKPVEMKSGETEFVEVFENKSVTTNTSEDVTATDNDMEAVELDQDELMPIRQSKRIRVQKRKLRE
ncbi:uncharacterized protein V1516DRAFT_675910 [Lipomyces oligophaga]|uniref:uncharacterized protein n=1 Tax=Lipomyces oligophaga TaxID=45792 RepID=UPI0034CF893D